MLEGLDGESYAVSAGGSLSNTLMALARLGQAAGARGGRPLRVAMAGVCGEDALGSFYAAQMRKAGVEVLSDPVPGANTGEPGLGGLDRAAACLPPCAGRVDAVPGRLAAGQLVGWAAGNMQGGGKRAQLAFCRLRANRVWALLRCLSFLLVGSTYLLAAPWQGGHSSPGALGQAFAHALANAPAPEPFLTTPAPLATRRRHGGRAYQPRRAAHHAVLPGHALRDPGGCLP